MFSKYISSQCMFFFKKFSSSFVFLLLFFSTQALAETPDEVLREIITKIKAASNTSPIVDYVDWSKAYKSTPLPRREFMGVDSAEAMKEYYREVLKDPVAVMKQQFKTKLETVPNAQKPALEQTFARMEQVMGERTKEMQLKVKGTEYEVGEPIIKDDKAMLPLKQTFNGVMKTEEVVFERSGDTWLLPTVGMMSGKAQ